MTHKQQKHYGMGILATWVIAIGWMATRLPATNSMMFLPGATSQILEGCAKIFIAGLCFFVVGLVWSKMKGKEMS